MQLGEWLQRSAVEVMVKDVITLKPTDRLSDAASRFMHKQISGAPVVDEQGRCVGVLSVKDILGAAEKDAQGFAKLVDKFFAGPNLALPTDVYDVRLSRVRDEAIPTAVHPVSEYMVTNLVFVKETDTLETVVRDLVDGQIHRVIVVDAEEKLSGIISTIDVLAALIACPKT